MTETQTAELKKLSDEAKALAGSKRIATEDGRAILNLLCRVIEVMSDGKPTTLPITRHHE